MSAVTTPGANERTVDVELFSVDGLIEQLRAGTGTLKLHDLVGAKYPHADVLHSYFLANLGQRVKWATCLHMLIEANAPVDHDARSTSAMFAHCDWNPAPELTRSLAEAYIAAGYINPNTPLPGELLTLNPSQPASPECDLGRSPLCSAIGFDNTAYVDFLLDHGASLNLGPMYLGEPDVDALTFAHEIGFGPVIASLAAAAMRAQIGDAAGSTPEAKRRRRMVV